MLGNIIETGQMWLGNIKTRKKSGHVVGKGCLMFEVNLCKICLGKI